MRFRVYGEVKDTKTGQAAIGAIVKLFLNEEELQQDKSANNGFYELIVEIDDSIIESGQQLLVTFEMEGYQKQEHRVLATEGAFNLDTKLDAAAPPPPKPFNWLPLVIAGCVVLLLLVTGVILFLILRPKAPKITSFSVNPSSIESGQSVAMIWETKKASTVEMLIDQNIVPVDLSGSKQVQPIQTTEYTLIARNEKGETRTSQTVEVKNAGNRASSDSMSLTTVDKIPPKVAITPAPFTVNPNQNITFTATASDAGDISKIQIYINGRRMKECSDSSCSYTGSPYALGSNLAYQAYAWDKSGNKGQSEATTLTVMNYNFESGSLDGWSRTGTAFSYQPTLGDNPTMRKRGQPSKHQGNYWIGTYEKHPSTKFAGGTIQGDAPTGTLTSRLFVIQSSKANFLVGGGAGSNVGVQLLIDGKIVLQARGKNNETMSRVTWDLSKYVNKRAQLRLVDNGTGAWGHINFDDFQFVSPTFPIRKLSPLQPLNLDVIKELPKGDVPKSP